VKELIARAVALLDRTPPWLRAWWPGLVLIGLGAWGFLGVADWVADQEDLYRLDQPLVEWFQSVRTPGVTAFLTGVTNTFGPAILPFALVVIALAWWRVTGNWWEPALVLGAVVLATGLAVILKTVFGRARPLDDFQTVPGVEDSFSFPSGHTIVAATLVLVTGYLAWRGQRHVRALVGWAVASVLLTLLVGGSRLYLGYHFLTDVVAGLFVAVLVLGVVVGVDRYRRALLTARG
jgi:undecaprenyl-diphosphatase